MKKVKCPQYSYFNLCFSLSPLYALPRHQPTIAQVSIERRCPRCLRRHPDCQPMPRAGVKREPEWRPKLPLLGRRGESDITPRRTHGIERVSGEGTNFRLLSLLTPRHDSQSFFSDVERKGVGGGAHSELLKECYQTRPKFVTSPIGLLSQCCFVSQCVWQGFA